MNVVSDFIILVIPLAAISKLQAPLKVKLGAISMFSIGIL